MTITDPRELGTILSVWGHPDDEAYLAAGLMAVAADNGQRVVCVTLTRGELGTPDPVAWPPDKLAAERTKEMEACMRTIGVREHHWFDYPDGGCGEVDDATAVARLVEVVTEVRPDTMLTFAPDGATGHPDHMAACRWTTAAFEQAAPPGARLYYATKTPEWNREFFSRVDPADVMMVEGLQPEEVPREQLAIYLKAEGALLKRKLAALACQATQTGPFLEAYGAEMYGRLTAEEMFRSP